MKIFALGLALYGIYAFRYWLKIYKNPNKCRVKFGPFGEQLFYKAPQKERERNIRRTAIWSMIAGLLCITLGICIFIYSSPID